MIALDQFVFKKGPVRHPSRSTNYFYCPYLGTFTGEREPHFRFPNYPKYKSTFLYFSELYVFVPADSKYKTKIGKNY